MFGINGSEFLVLLVVAAVVLGPERLPHYTQQLTRLIRELRQMAQGAQEKVREELGPEFEEVNWRALDPRQYDPRRIVREALSDAVDLDDPLGLRAGPGGSRPARAAAAGAAGAGAAGAGAAGAGAAGAPGAPRPDDADEPPVFDPDAT